MALCLFAKTKEQKRRFISAESLHLSRKDTYIQVIMEVSILCLYLTQSSKMGDGYTSSIHFYEAMYRTCALDIQT